MIIIKIIKRLYKMSDNYATQIVGGDVPINPKPKPKSFLNHVKHHANNAVNAIKNPGDT